MHRIPFFLSPLDVQLDTLEETLLEVAMSRSYILVLLSVFALFFLQLFGDDLPWAFPASIALIILIVGATLFQLRRTPNR
ncbi:hypothetical protein EVJ29_03905 [Exiguobacterium sp. SH4S7]|uniref:hypothetical protein n=2 Tax=Exiguobacterium TaxID=33986 RepID=UPI0010EE877B|nr:hypothetical protein [Exiguobacterium sp. SH4S7]TCI39791.1 hypothetical protein EVJ29_03905 [Exiguobacterium sp. SH4S7]